jgi:WD40 repeat protein
LNTGKRLRTLQDAPPRGIVTLSVFPDGSQFFTQEEVPGDFDGSRPRALSLWNVATGEHRQVNSGSAHAMCYAPDGRRVAIALPRPGDDQMYFNGSVKILALPDLREVCTIPIDRERAYAWVSCFALDGAVAIGTLTWYVNPDNYQKHDSALKMWDTATGQEVFSLPQPGKEDYFTGVVASPDGRSMVVTSVDRKANRGRVHLVDVAQRASQVLLETDGLPGRLVFHPSEDWCAMAVQSYPKSLNPRDPSVDDLPQPSILCLDAKTGEILEKVLTPPAFLSSIAFSPDGQTLATSGNGEVLLWDFRVPPGKLSNVAAK